MKSFIKFLSIVVQINKFLSFSVCVKGSNPVVGDRVLVEASYNPSMPFKWNATRVQVLPMVNNNNSSNTQQTNQPNRQQQQQQQQQQPNRTSGTYNAVPPPTENSNNRWSDRCLTCLIVSLCNPSISESCEVELLLFVCIEYSNLKHV